jgi:hypothetical protein
MIKNFIRDLVAVYRLKDILTNRPSGSNGEISNAKDFSEAAALSSEVPAEH